MRDQSNKNTNIDDASTAEQSDEVAAAKVLKPKGEKEYGGRNGPEPTRYGDWEKNGIISDF